MAVDKEKPEILTVSDIPDGGEWIICDGEYQRQAVLDNIDVDEDLQHGSLFVTINNGEYDDVIWFPGIVPHLGKRAIRIQ
jgi:hypothetical protein